MADHQQHLLPSLDNLPNLQYLQTEDEQDYDLLQTENDQDFDLLPQTEEQLVEEMDKHGLVKEIEEITSYRFKNPNLLEQAFTDSSYDDINCCSYQRLEFFGDSVLNYLVAEELYFRYPDLDPGKLTLLRAANVDTEKLARVAINHSFHKFLRHKKPLRAGQIEEFKEAILEYPLHSYGLIDAPKVLADIVESLIGAIHIDSNRSWGTTLQVVKKLLEPMITLDTLQMHPVTKLYELCQKHGATLKIVDLYWKQSGEVEVYIDEEFVGRGKYCTKKPIAINRAADNAYKQIAARFSTVENIDNGENNS